MWHLFSVEYHIFSCVGGTLLPDFFLDVGPEDLVKQMEEGGATPAFGHTSKKAEPAPASDDAASGPAATFKTIEGMITQDLINSMKGTFAFDLKGEGLCILKHKLVSTYISLGV